MTKIDLKIENLPIKALTPYSKNAKKHPRKQLENQQMSMFD